MGLTDLQVYNLFAGLTVVVVLFGSLGYYALTHGASQNAESKHDPKPRH